MAEKKTVDARNMPCPEPVLKTKKALEGITEGKLTVLVNSTEACQNVQYFAQSQGCSVTTTEKDCVFTIEINKENKDQEKDKSGDDVLLIASDQLGTGDKSLGQLLTTAFINTLPEAKARPARIIFINRGVMLTAEGSGVIDTLERLAKEGVQIFSCGTCLNHYQLKDKLKVGQVTNMYDIVDSLLTANRVVRI